MIINNKDTNIPVSNKFYSPEDFATGSPAPLPALAVKAANPQPVSYPTLDLITVARQKDRSHAPMTSFMAFPSPAQMPLREGLVSRKQKQAKICRQKYYQLTSLI